MPGSRAGRSRRRPLCHGAPSQAGKLSHCLQQALPVPASCRRHSKYLESGKAPGDCRKSRLALAPQAAVPWGAGHAWGRQQRAGVRQGCLSLGTGAAPGTKRLCRQSAAGAPLVPGASVAFGKGVPALLCLWWPHWPAHVLRLAAALRPSPCSQAHHRLGCSVSACPQAAGRFNCQIQTEHR